MKTIALKIKAHDTRNELHFEVQRKTHAQVFRNRKKYTRKCKHKNALDY